MNKQSKLYKAIKEAVADGRLAPQFRMADVKRACPGWSEGTYAAFLAKHAIDNPYGNREYFERVGSRIYRLA